MSIIPCTEGCVYQQDGNCSLERAASLGTPNTSSVNCAHYIEKQTAQRNAPQHKAF